MLYDYNLNQQVQRLTQQVNCLIKDGCCRVKRCLGISAEGDPNLVLNQQGDWIPLRNIVSFFALTSKIDFISNGGDDYSISFFIDPITTQLPVGVTIVDYDYRVTLWVGGTPTNLEDGVKSTDYTYNSIGNGAGVYELKCRYSLSNGEHLFIQGLVKVDGVGNILQSIFINGLTVNSTNGLNINLTLENNQTNYTGDVLFATSNGSTTVLVLNNGVNKTATITTHIGDIYILSAIDLDSTWNDYAGDFSTNSIIIIS